MSSPLMSALTAIARIAPSGRRRILPPMPIDLASQARGCRTEPRHESCGVSTQAGDCSIRQAEPMTVRTLVLLRHAKAETPGELPDFDRQLTEKGNADAD